MSKPRGKPPASKAATTEPAARKSSRAKHNQDAAIRGKVQGSALARSLAAGAPLDIQVPPAPSLEGLVVNVPPVQEVWAADVVEALHQALRDKAPRRRRAPGEKVDWGDDVVLDTVGYAGGRIIPFSFMERVTMEVVETPALPGFAEALVGLETEKSAKVDVALPLHHPVEALRGKDASFLVDIHETYAVTPAKEDDPAALARLGLGSNLDDAMERLAQHLAVQRMVDRARETRDRVLDELAARVTTPVPNALVEDEIRQRWAATEGRLAVLKGFQPAEQEELLNTWLQDAEMRFEVERQVRVSLALAAVAKQHKVYPTREDVGNVVADVAQVLGLEKDVLAHLLRHDRPAATRVLDHTAHLAAVAHVMSKVTFNASR
jgi:trigger factor